MNRDVLCRPFEPAQLKRRQGQRGKTYTFVEVADIIERLNEGLTHWSFEVVSHEILSNEVVVLGRLTAEGAIIKCAFGGSSITRDREERIVSIADDLKASASDALKKCASLLGVGLEFYRRDAREDAPGATSDPRRSAANEPVERLTPRQFAAIQQACRKKNVGRDQLAALIERRTKKTGVQFLTRGEASGVLSELAGLNGAHP